MLATGARQDGCGEMQKGELDMSKARCWVEIRIFGVVFLPSEDMRPLGVSTHTQLRAAFPGIMKILTFSVPCLEPDFL